MDEWIEDFEKRFNISIHKDTYKMIIGKQPYLQKIGNKEIRVDITGTSIKYYKFFNTAAFVVNDWVKVQDSLEMIFNLLTRDSAKTLKILSFLRTKKDIITPVKFIQYLLDRHNMILVNKYDKDGIKSNAIKEITKKINEDESQKVNILFIGDNQFYQGLQGTNGLINNIGYVFHSSGVVLNMYPKLYEEIWYKFNESYVKNESKNPKVRLKVFGVLE